MLRPFRCRLSTEYDDSEGNDDWIVESKDRRPLVQPEARALDSTPQAPTVTRPRRAASGGMGTSITVARAPSKSPDETKKSIRLTVKMPSSKLREATSGTTKSISVNSRDTFEPGEILSGPRGSRAKKSYVVDSPSEDEDDEEQEEDDDVVPSEDDEEEEDEDAEGESEEADPEADADGDIDMDEEPTPRPPIIKMSGPASKPSLTVTPAQEGKVKGVEAKEMQLDDDDDDEDLSSLESDAEVEDDEDAGDSGQPGPIGADMEMEQDDEDLDSDEGTPATGSRASTPDVSKMTKRQRSRLDQVMGGDFLQLPMEPQTKKHLTAEEHAMRRAEMARRRKNLSEKRNEEEKMDTINRLLKKQAPKRRGKISAAETNANGDMIGTPQLEAEYEKPNPVFVRWVSDSKGCRVGVPEEWLGTPVGRVFEARRGSGRMVKEVVEG
ncbi:MAG: hypothetical protein FRX48_01751 [Lasallia pustulata]|uniref:INO80 complex subunit B-like conserved region domain-containing protein n=1 Tax=Lasallia pustulata TaxID=136370 RepID=A0A5M8Q1A1_9LECA|nr:MAG: hypothetical protein FRX48_01751 [Lasallia pustulata]